MRTRLFLIVVTLFLIAIVLQTALFSQTRFLVPDLAMFLVIVLGLTRIRPESVLGIAFLAGISVDLLGSSVLGLRAVVYVVVAYAAVRSRQRADAGRVAAALWAGVITLSGVVLLLTLGTLFGQGLLLGDGVLERVFFGPIGQRSPYADARADTGAVHRPGFERFQIHMRFALRLSILGLTFIVMFSVIGLRLWFVQVAQGPGHRRGRCRPNMAHQDHRSGAR